MQNNKTAYTSILLGIAPVILAAFLYFLRGPGVQPAIAIWVISLLTAIITAPLLGVIGIIMSKRAKKEGCDDILTKIGFICSIINITIMTIPAIILLFFLFVHAIS